MKVIKMNGTFGTGKMSKQLNTYLYTATDAEQTLPHKKARIDHSSAARTPYMMSIQTDFDKWHMVRHMLCQGKTNYS